MKPVDYTLYLVTDPREQGKYSFFEAVKHALDGGVSVVQLRDKDATLDSVKSTALKLKALLEPYCVPLIINDHLELAKAIGADGVHLGKSDGQVSEARKYLGPDFILGYSIESASELEGIELAQLDYLAASPVFETRTKSFDKPALGLNGLAEIRLACSIPLIAIGGINTRTINQLNESQLDGIAVISDLMWSDDPKQTAQQLRTQFKTRKASNAHYA